MSLIQGSYPFIGYHDAMRLTTALLDGGYRDNAVVLHEAADAMRDDDPAWHVSWLRDRAREMES